MFSIRRVTKNLQWGNGRLGGLEAQTEGIGDLRAAPPALEKKIFFAKIILGFNQKQYSQNTVNHIY